MSGWNIPALFSVRAVCENSVPNRRLQIYKNVSFSKLFFQEDSIIAFVIVKNDLHSSRGIF